MVRGNMVTCPDCGYHDGYHSDDCGPRSYPRVTQEQLEAEKARIREQLDEEWRRWRDANIPGGE